MQELNIWNHYKEPKKRKPIDKNTRDAVWIRYMKGKAVGKCYCCRVRPIHFTDFQVGHNKSVARGGKDNITNLRPICRPCNTGMGTMSIERYRTRFTLKKPSAKVSRAKARRRKPSNDALDFGMFEPPKRSKGMFDLKF